MQGRFLFIKVDILKPASRHLQFSIEMKCSQGLIGSSCSLRNLYLVQAVPQVTYLGQAAPKVNYLGQATP